MIVFSHANSYGASTYRRLFDAWRAARAEKIIADAPEVDADAPDA